MVVRKLDPRQWRTVRRTFDLIRQKFFTVDVYPVQLRLDTTIDGLREELGRRHFTNAWELSFRYKGEDLNMRRPEYVDDEYEWYQLHVRAFETDEDYIEVHVHLELEPTAYPYEHVNDIEFSDEAGLDMLTNLLDDAEIDYEHIS